jgi:hypothetical protein
MASQLIPAVGATLTSSYATIYTVPASTTSTIVTLHASNTGTGNVAVSIQWLDASASNAARNLGTDISVPQNAAWNVLDGQKLVLGAGDVIQAKRGASGTADITISAMEQS